MIREPFHRFYSSTATNYAESIKARKNEERARLAADTEAFLARGGVIAQLPPFAMSTDLPPYIELTFENTPQHNPALAQARDKRRRRYGRLS